MAGDRVLRLIAIGYPLVYFFAVDSVKTMTDATGSVWSVHDFRETSAMVSLYTMLFAVAISSIKLLQKQDVR